MTPPPPSQRVWRRARAHAPALPMSPGGRPCARRPCFLLLMPNAIRPERPIDRDGAAQGGIYRAGLNRQAPVRPPTPPPHPSVAALSRPPSPVFFYPSTVPVRACCRGGKTQGGGGSGGVECLCVCAVCVCEACPSFQEMGKRESPLLHTQRLSAIEVRSEGREERHGPGSLFGRLARPGPHRSQPSLSTRQGPHTGQGPALEGAGAGATGRAGWWPGRRLARIGHGGQERMLLWSGRHAGAGPATFPALFAPFHPALGARTPSLVCPRSRHGHQTGRSVPDRTRKSEESRPGPASSAGPRKTGGCEGSCGGHDRAPPARPPTHPEHV